MIEFKVGRSLEQGQLVKVYKNLNRDCFSIMDYKSRLVIGWASSVMLRNVKFVVSKAGQSKAREQQTRNVHAYAIGEYIGEKFVASPGFNPPAAREVYYNPFTTNSFIDSKTETPITEAPFAYLAGGKCFILRKGGFTDGK
ncbi:hypothetical protein ACWA2C_27995 [Priestia megaterium]